MNSRTVIMIPQSAFAPFVAPDGTLVGQGDADVSFTVIGPAGMRIVGTTPELTVADDGERVTVTVSLIKLNTGIPLRDAHMREKYLEVGKYPKARLTVDRASLKFPVDGRVEATVLGTLTIHGVSREVSFRYSAVRSGAWLHIASEARINMTEYGVVVPPYLGMTVKPHVALRVSFSVLEC